MHYEMITVTPELAERWLQERNNRNRPISKNIIGAYVSDMARGRWKKSQRKYIRIALTEKDNAAFQAAKQHAENSTAVEMSDSMFALSVIRQAIKQMTK